jgi:diketogulonate reductase-like aldo/keto reductase
MKKAYTLSNEIATDQVLYNLMRRGIEWDLLPWCQKNKIPIMAYSPIEQGRLLRHPVLKKIAARLSATPAQVALAWVLQQSDVMAIPKAGTREHVIENRAALDIKLTNEDLMELDDVFPYPSQKGTLEII